MADEGSTTTGSIRAKLTLDDSDFKGKLDEAGAQAEALNGVDPKIKVTADTGDASAKMDAVALAAARLDIANQAVQLSYLKLDAIQSDDEASQASVAAAHLAASRAELTQAQATDKLAAAQLAAAGATDTETGAQDDQNASSGENVQQWQLIAGAIAGVIALGAPLSAFIAGVGGGLAGMGAAGVLAVLGINNAIKQGTEVGNTYSVGLSALKQSLNGIESTAASDVLGAFDIAVNKINGDMPNLNSEIGTFSGILGTIADDALDGVLNALNVMNPLLDAGATYVEGLAQQFDAWTSDGGLQQFVTYAEQELPIVENALGATTSAVIGLATSLGPLGNDILEIVTDGSKLLTWLTSLQGDLQSTNPTVNTFVSGLESALNPIQDAENLWGMLNGVIDYFTGTTKKAATSSDTTSFALLRQQSAAQDAAQAEDRLTTSQSNATAAAQKYASFIAAQTNDQLKLQQSIAALQGDYNNLGTTVLSNEQTMSKAAATSMDVTTSAGLQNHNNILQAISDNEAEAAAVYQTTLEQTGSKQKAAAAANAALQSNDDALVTNATKAGLNAAAVQTLINTIVKIPPTATTIITASITGAEATLAKWKAEVAAAPTAPGTGTTPGPAYSHPEDKPGKAHGGEIGFAGGGSVAGFGSSFSDSVRNVRLSVGEEVTSMPYARQFRPALKALNAGNPQAAIAALGGHRAVSSQPASFQVQLISNGIDIIKFIDMKITDAAGNTYAAVSGGSVL